MSEPDSALIERRRRAARGAKRWKRHITALCKEYTSDAVITLVEIMNDAQMPPSSRVKAAENILDRGWGKAPVVVKSQDGAPLDLSQASESELLKIIAENRKRIEDEGDEEEEYEDEFTAEFEDDVPDDEIDVNHKPGKKVH